MVLRVILGAVYLGMAVGQLASWRRMPEILAAYQAVPDAAIRPLAVALLVGEAVAGIWFLARPRSQALGPVWAYTAVSLVWAGLGVQAYLRGVEVLNCGCFGVYLAQRLSWFVLAQDALLLLYAALMIRAGLRAQRPAPSAALEEAVIAESDDTVVVEGNHYFPPGAVRWQHLAESGGATVRPWKSIASYYTVTVHGVSYPDTAWTYRHPIPWVRRIKNRVAFWGGVQLEEVR